MIEMRWKVLDKHNDKIPDYALKVERNFTTYVVLQYRERYPELESHSHNITVATSWRDVEFIEE